MIDSTRRRSSNRARPPATNAAAATDPVETRNRRRSKPSDARDGPGVSMLPAGAGRTSQRSTGMPTAVPTSGGSAADADSPGRCSAASVPTSPITPIPTAPASGLRTATTPTISAAMASVTTMPTRSAILSLVPNHRIAMSFSHGGTRSMNSLPTASIGETTSMMPATSIPVVTATAPATRPARAPYRRGIDEALVEVGCTVTVVAVGGEDDSLIRIPQSTSGSGRYDIRGYAIVSARGSRRTAPRELSDW